VLILVFKNAMAVALLPFIKMFQGKSEAKYKEEFKKSVDSNKQLIQDSLDKQKEYQNNIDQNNANKEPTFKPAKDMTDEEKKAEWKRIMGN